MVGSVGLEPLDLDLDRKKIGIGLGEDARRHQAALGQKLQRARQAPKPAWVSRTAFRMDEGPRRLYLGVGSAKLPAGAQLVALQDALPSPQGATPLDWYLDEATGTLYALTVEERR